MINPNATSIHYGRVVNLSRGGDGSLNIKVILETGHMVEELGFIFHKTLELGDIVRCTIGFSIMSDRHGIRHISKMRVSNHRYHYVVAKINRHGYYTACRLNLKAVSNE